MYSLRMIPRDNCSISSISHFGFEYQIHPIIKPESNLLCRSIKPSTLHHQEVAVALVAAPSSNCLPSSPLYLSVRKSGCGNHQFISLNQFSPLNLRRSSSSLSVGSCGSCRWQIDRRRLGFFTRKGSESMLLGTASRGDISRWAAEHVSHS
ncbi:hypothetical protein L2E82_16832 [Cichorium intybus]|uniref:Uncharacterized protein n=1 Tax=Cichorium intybus TaxID=13427 RepID=A0ACB9F735_CICIN|nr:hypothetical protein L2E82_16832 [Cichorium intybus]